MLIIVYIKCPLYGRFIRLEQATSHLPLEQRENQFYPIEDIDKPTQ